MSTPIWKSRIMKFAAGLVFICLLSSPAFALDQTYGNEWRCTDWLEARDKVNNWIHGTSRHAPGEKIPTDDVVPSAWLIGFLEGYNWDACKEILLLASTSYLPVNAADLPLGCCEEVDQAA